MWEQVDTTLAITPADEAARRIAMDHYVEVDIAYKYYPDTVTELMSDPEPNRIIPDAPSPELYNIAADPYEETDLAEREPDRLSAMMSSLESWCEEVEYDRAHVNNF